jgi:hypothetical protein
MSKYSIEVELFKGEEPIDFPDDFDGDEIDNAVFAAKLALEKGQADRIVIYIAKKNELLEIITESKDTFDIGAVTTKINSIKEQYDK